LRIGHQNREAGTADLREQLQESLSGLYTIERELGGGGMARVFLAHETALGRRVVVKVLSPTLAAGVSVDRFRREILLVAKLQHPHIVPVHAAGELGGLPYFTMPFVEGESLRARLAREGELPISEVLRLLRDVASALTYAHAQGVIHRDIKPDNVLLSVGSAIVADFGVAKALSESVTDGDQSHLTSLGIALGTPAYMAPEQASADPAMDHRVDIYAFGVMAYEMLAGRPPFIGRSPQALFAAHVNEPPVPVQALRPSVPPALAALIMRCLEKHAADRPTQADDLLHALDSMSTPSGGTPPTTEMPAHRESWASAVKTVPARRPPWPVIAGAAVVVLGAALVLLPRGDRDAAASPGGVPSAVVDSPSAGERSGQPPGTVPEQADPPPPPAPAAAPARSTSRSAREGPASPAASARLPVPAGPDTSVMSRLRSSALEARRTAVAAGATAARIAEGDSTIARAEALRRAGRIEEASIAFSTASAQWAAATAAASASQRAENPAPAQPQREAEPPPVPAPEQTPADPRPAIEAAVAEYATAIESRSTARIRRANPGLTDAQEQDWRQFFDAVGSIQVSLKISQLQVTDDAAEAALTGTYVFENTTTRRTDQQPVSIRMSLRRVGGAWRVTGIR
jgi:serine/threonine-protein kinase